VLTEEIVEQAAYFHGHLGPFLMIGVRMGLTGLKGLDACTNEGLCITVSLPFRVPFSCIIDGIQVTTKCTVGNQKLLIRDSEKIQAEFRRKDKKKRIVISLKDSALEELRTQLRQEGTTDEQVRQIALKIAATPESNLFTIN
jgi:formylmethanofuran dehydrogenase subunit E